MVLLRPTRPSRTNTRNRCPFHHRGLECKSRKTRNTWSNRQIWPWNTNEAGQRLTEFCQENTLVIENTFLQQYKRQLCISTSPDGQYRYHIDNVLFSWRWRCSKKSAKTRLGTDCDSDHELLIAKFRLKLKKVGKTIRPFRYFSIPYGYKVEVTSRF